MTDFKPPSPLKKKLLELLCLALTITGLLVVGALTYEVDPPSTQTTDVKKAP